MKVEQPHEQVTLYTLDNGLRVVIDGRTMPFPSYQLLSLAWMSVPSMTATNPVLAIFWNISFIETVRVIIKNCVSSNVCQ